MIRRFDPTVLAILTLACAAPVTVAPPPDARVQAIMTQYGLPAVGIAVIADGRIAWSKVYGEQAPGVPATDATLFGVASLTKPVTAETILRLVAAGKIDLDEPMSRFWVDPDLTGDPRHQALTPRIALSHQTGFLNWRKGALAFQFDPGTSYGYSGEGYQYLGRFAERKFGRAFESLAAEYVFRPIGLASTSYSARSWMAGRKALPKAESGPFGESHVPPEGEWNGANNLATTARDYATFVISVMKRERLDPALAAERFRIHRAVDGPDCRATRPEHRCPTAHGMTLGWERLDYPDGPVLLHTGNNAWGESSIGYFEPSRRHGLVILSNGANLTKAYFDFFGLLDPGSPLAAWPR